VPPPGVRLFFGDTGGRPCTPADSFHWTYEHAPAWYYVSETGIPPHELAIRPNYPAGCPKCPVRQLKVVTKTDKNGRESLALVCGRCGRWLKALRAFPRNPDLEYHAIP
jgi:hypothetical protein